MISTTKYHKYLLFGEIHIYKIYFSVAKEADFFQCQGRWQINFNQKEKPINNKLY